ncbi:hypothetical protein ACEYYH_14370 [Microbacterium trichothecenolyticum]|uniref:hypothetical protein n=1 Tax=Microbacterium trichothecenolyticum TaxID=69370 RepID=UPI0035BE4292
MCDVAEDRVLLVGGLDYDDGKLIAGCGCQMTRWRAVLTIVFASELGIEGAEDRHHEVFTVEG